VSAIAGAKVVLGVSAAPVLQASFDDLYSAAYEILDDAKTDHELVKLYKGSHASPDPHPSVTDFGEYFYRTRRGLIAYACEQANPQQLPTLADLDAFDAARAPRIGLRSVFDLLLPIVRRPHESADDVLDYLTSRTHQLGAYRGGSSGYDEETRAFAAAHFRSLGMSTAPGEVLIFCGGAKGAFMAFCAAIMCRRRHDDLDRLGGLLLTPVGYYQSLRLIPPIFGGDIHVTAELTDDAVRDWLTATADQPRRCVYVPLVNNTDGRVLTRRRALSIAAVVLEHNMTHPAEPVYVLADDVYVGSYLTPEATGVPIAAIAGTDLGDPMLGRMSDWTLTVATASKTFALPTARVAFATTTSPALSSAVAHYRTVLSQGRVTTDRRIDRCGCDLLDTATLDRRVEQPLPHRPVRAAGQHPDDQQRRGFRSFPYPGTGGWMVSAAADLASPHPARGKRCGCVRRTAALRRRRP
jgi:aspartate/methionine/tyrosine aminotransferase